MMKLIIQVPCYNEAQTLEIALNHLPKHIDGIDEIEYLIINDGSRDDTYEIASAECETHPLLTVLTKPNGGHGSTVLYGYRYALENGADYIYQTCLLYTSPSPRD